MAPVFVYVTSRVMALNHQNSLKRSASSPKKVYVVIFKLIAVIFLIIEGVALIIGVRLTRSITATVDKLYDATERVKKGDLSYRIQVPSAIRLVRSGKPLTV